MAEELRSTAEGQTRDELVRLAVETIPDHAFLTFNPAGIITSWNIGAERLFGDRRDDMVGQHLSAAFGQTARHVWIGMADLHQAQRDGCILLSRPVLDTDGTATDVRATILAVRTESELAGYAVVAHPLRERDGRGDSVPSDDAPATSPLEDARRELSNSKTLLAAEIADRTQAEAARVRLLRRLVVGQEEERRRIARDLHDDLGQRLTALRLVLEAISRTDSNRGEHASGLANALQMLARIDQSLDFMAWELRPAALDQLGLVRVLETYVEEWSRHAGIPAVFHANPGHLNRLTAEVEASAYRIAQEALNNVAKHSAAHSVNVLLELRAENIVLVVEDDGVGFRPGTPAETMIGVTGMRERALAVGGTLDIEPTPEGGTTVMACIPTCAAPNDLSRHAMALQGTIAPTADVDERMADDGGAHESALDSIRLRLQELQQAVGARDEFIATVAHELRNPIAPLTFQVRLALNKLEQTGTAGRPVSVEWMQSQLRGMEQRLHRLLETLDRLLDVSRLSSGRIDLQFEQLDLADVVREVISSLEGELAVARCQVTLSAQGGTIGSWDRLRVEQICRNLLSNAIRFGAGRPIDIALAGDRDFATVQVRDHGVGIPAAQQSRIFERFERGVEQRSGGFGIGLWIVRNVCVAMGGSVSVESELGNGACFTVMLPRRTTSMAVTVRKPLIAGLE